jgi:hypothetical protein
MHLLVQSLEIAHSAPQLPFTQEYVNESSEQPQVEPQLPNPSLDPVSLPLQELKDWLQYLLLLEFGSSQASGGWIIPSPQ